jgi:membrane protein implicated in regulation of membrane protease activity
MDEPEQWRLIWLAATAVFAIGEMLSPGSFFLAPFAVGALAAAVMALLGMSIGFTWLVFIVVSIATLAAMRPLAHRLDREVSDHGVGAKRIVGNRATVLQEIPGGSELGLVLIDREEWRAQSTDGSPIAERTVVRIADVQGTRVIVSADTSLPEKA